MDRLAMTAKTGVMHMNPEKGCAFLITGGSSGLGWEVARRLLDRGYSVGLMARNEKRLNEAVSRLNVEASRVVACVGDAADPEACSRAVKMMTDAFGGLNGLVCCAGMSMRASVESTEFQIAENVMRANFWTVFHATQAALPSVLARKGSLVAVASLAGHRGVPGYGVYGAAKRAVIGLYESLRLEVSDAGVHVGIFSPGFFESPLRRQVLNGKGEVIDPPPSLPFRLWPLDRCADLVVQSLERRKRLIYLPGFMRYLNAFDDVTGGGLGDRFLKSRFRGL
jgi:NAD(P)-dependent dehydrogenase (short-subunit alcohol dehydrogenase family)